MALCANGEEAPKDEVNFSLNCGERNRNQRVNYSAQSGKVKNPIHSKRLWFIVLLAIFILTAMSGCVGSFDGNKNSSNTANISPNGGKVDGGEYAPKQAFKLYLDVFSERNLLFSTYDIVVRLDDEELGVVKNGEYLQEIFDVEKGDHVLTFAEKGSSSKKTTRNITVNGEMTLQCDLKHDRNGITIRNVNMEEGVAGYSIEVPNVVGMTVAQAIETLNSVGIKNIDKPLKVTDQAAWKVTGQNIIAGQKIKSRDEIKLECKSLNDYYSSLFKDKTVSEARAAAEQEGVSFVYLDNATGEDVGKRIADTDESNLQYWTINKAEVYSGVENTVALSVTYLGTPEERAAWAEEEARAKEEAERKAKEEAEKRAQEEAERKAEEEARKKELEEEEEKAREENRANGSSNNSDSTYDRIMNEEVPKYRLAFYHRTKAVVEYLLFLKGENVIYRFEKGTYSSKKVDHGKYTYNSDEGVFGVDFEQSGHITLKISENGHDLELIDSYYDGKDHQYTYKQTSVSDVVWILNTYSYEY